MKLTLCDADVAIKTSPTRFQLNSISPGSICGARLCTRNAWEREANSLIDPLYRMPPTYPSEGGACECGWYDKVTHFHHARGMYQLNFYRYGSTQCVLSTRVYLLSVS